MDTLRLVAAMVTVVIALPLWLSWMLIHPLVSVWRKLGGVTYIFVLFFLIGVMTGIYKLYNVHDDLQFFGTNYLTVGLSVICLSLGKFKLCNTPNKFPSKGFIISSVIFNGVIVEIIHT